MVNEELILAAFSVVQVGNADVAIAILVARLDIHLVFTDIDPPGSIRSAIDGESGAAAVASFAITNITNPESSKTFGGRGRDRRQGGEIRA
jgi:hypothetical protein